MVWEKMKHWMTTTLTWPNTKDFFFWGVVKYKVCEKNPKTIKELKDYIHGAYVYNIQVSGLAADYGYASRAVTLPIMFTRFRSWLSIT